MSYSDGTYVAEMSKYVGRVAIIKDGSNEEWCTLEGIPYVFHPDWLELASEIPQDSPESDSIPTLGVRPREEYETLIRKNRALELLRAIMDHVQEGKSFPVEWLLELNEMWEVKEDG